MTSNKHWLTGLIILTVLSTTLALAEDWPTYMHDAQRSGITPMVLDMPLDLEWTHVPNQGPEPAWPEPAKQDYWHQIRDLSPVVIYDRAFHVVSVGDALFYSSSSDDQVYCLDTATGAIRWRFFTEGPVRLAPAVVDGRVYFSSDDGYAYCVQANTGALVWKYTPSEYDRRLPGNSRIISYVPARTGVLVDNGIAYFFSGLFPPKQVYKCALDAVTGEVLQSDTASGISPQGYLLASSTRIFVPTGRTAPFMFDREGLAPIGAMQGPGGAYALLVDNAVISGPGVRNKNQLYDTAQDTRERVASFPGIRMLVRDGIAYLQSPGEAAALDRPRYLKLSIEISKREEVVDELKKELRDIDSEDKDAQKQIEEKMKELNGEIRKFVKERRTCYLWKHSEDDPFSMILAGDTLFMGGQDRIYALRTSDGKKVWQAKAEGRIYGLAAANGRLYASSNTGAIYCFGTGETETARIAAMPQTDTPYPEDEWSALYKSAARAIIKHAGITQGYCMVLGAGEGRLAYEISKISELCIVGVEQDAARIAAARNALIGTGLYGKRIVMQQVTSNRLPYTSYMANLIVSEEALLHGAFSWNPKEIYRMLRPYGGKAYLPRDGIDASVYRQLRDSAKQATDIVKEDAEWFILERGAVSGAGKWTQLYADASHTASSGDELQGPVTIQWFGEPGPREMVDRHHRPMSALFQEGQLFITANNKIITVDGYNGSPLWELEVPDSRRVGSMKNSGHQLLTNDALYIARKGECWKVDLPTGEHQDTLKIPESGSALRDWGYLNYKDDLLIGSGQAQGASFSKMGKDMINVLEGDYRPVVMSECLFAIDRTTGEKRWVYENGRILNGMLSTGEDRLYLVESRNDKAMSTVNGRISINDFLKEDAHLVALDLHTGAIAWEHPVIFPFDHIAYLNGDKGTLIASGSYNEKDQLFYDLFAFDMASGNERWHTKFPGMNIRGTDRSGLEGSHGEQWQHPVITGDTIFARPFAFSLETGEQKDYLVYRGGHGCGGLTGSEHYLYGRGSVPRMYDTTVNHSEGTPLSEVSRPGCWLNIIPAGGMVLVPEASSGCTCAYPLQTSIALIPEALAGSIKRKP
ncbi:MAG: PQQ-binding-like beta-propeller repeat protein [Candidatus Hydrogenedentes bacterium]|nr:PQQ-binding-like beta-propeller repeat protein [Candidatus Hydrogenedentota bacterium]